MGSYDPLERLEGKTGKAPFFKVQSGKITVCWARTRKESYFIGKRGFLSFNLNSSNTFCLLLDLLLYPWTQLILANRRTFLNLQKRFIYFLFVGQLKRGKCKRFMLISEFYYLEFLFAIYV